MNMSEADNADLQDAIRHRNDMKAAFDRITEDAGPKVQKHVAAIVRGERAGDMTPEVREATAQILGGRGYVEDAEAQVARVRGYPKEAKRREAQRDIFWRKRNEIQAGR